MAKKNNQIGKITHYYPRIKVGIIELSAGIKQGDKLQFGDKDEKTSFEQVIGEMQYDHQEIESGKKGQEVGVLVEQKVKKGIPVYLVE